MDIILIDDQYGRDNLFENAVQEYNENLSNLFISLSFNVRLSKPIDRNRIQTKREAFDLCLNQIANFSSEQAIFIIDINLQLSPEYRIELRDIYREKSIEFPSYFTNINNNKIDVSKNGIMALMSEVILNINIKKALIFISSSNSDSFSLDNINIPEFFRQLILNKNRCREVKYNFDNKFILENRQIDALAIVTEATKNFDRVFNPSIHIVIEQLLIAQAIESHLLSHPLSPLLPNCAHIDNDSLFGQLFYWNLVQNIPETSCKALLSDRPYEVNTELLKVIFTLYGFTLSCSIDTIALPCKFGIVFIAHILRFLKEIKYYGAIALERNDTDCKKILTLDLQKCTRKFTPSDVEKLQKLLSTETEGGSTSKYLKEILSCDTSIIDYYFNSYTIFNNMGMDLNTIKERFVSQQSIINCKLDINSLILMLSW